MNQNYSIIHIKKLDYLSTSFILIHSFLQTARKQNEKKKNLQIERANQRNVCVNQRHKTRRRQQMPQRMALKPRLWLTIQPALIRERTETGRSNQHQCERQSLVRLTNEIDCFVGFV